MADDLTTTQQYNALKAVETGAYMLQGVSAIFMGRAQSKMNKLRARQLQTDADFAEAALNDELLNGLANMQVQAAQSGVNLGNQVAKNVLADMAKKQADAQKIRMRAKADAANLAYQGGQAKLQGAMIGLQNFANVARSQYERKTDKTDADLDKLKSGLPKTGGGLPATK